MICIGVLFPYIPHSMYILNQISFLQIIVKGRALYCYSQGYQVVQRFVLKKSIADKFQNIKSWQNNVFIFKACLLLGNQQSSTRPKVFVLQGSLGQYIHLFSYIQFCKDSQWQLNICAAILPDFTVISPGPFRKDQE